jgi:hypothetical protein
VCLPHARGAQYAATAIDDVDPAASTSTAKSLKDFPAGAEAANHAARDTVHDASLPALTVLYSSCFVYSKSGIPKKSRITPVGRNPLRK